MRRLLLPALCAGVVFVSACQQEAPPPAPVAEAPKPAAPPEPTNEVPKRPHRFDPAITAEDFARHVATLSSDEFEGRAPGSMGERATTTYLQSEFERIGLAPGNGTSYFQSVPMMETTVDPSTTLTVTAGTATQALALGTDMVVGHQTGRTEVTVTDAPLVFAGYGVTAPEYGWDDYANLDVKGKVVVVLVNDPGFIRGDKELFKGPEMTYYGRWTYKFEEAARHGATGALIVHDTDAASYDWAVVKNSWTGPDFSLPVAEDPEPRLDMQGWLSADAATKLFAAAGQDLGKLRLLADQRGFVAVPLDAKVSTTIKAKIRSDHSNNVVAILRGTDQPDEAVVYMAHWDHLGKHEDETGDNIYNGAIDNATGVAGALEIAEAFAHQEPKPKRSILFMIPTLEESGLLGSRYYAAHPVIPMAKTMAAINMDALYLRGRAKDMQVVGSGQSDLEDVLKEILAAQGRVVTPDQSPQSGFYFRSDQFNFAKKGVPALYTKVGQDLVDGGITAGQADAADYTAKRYHRPDDEFHAGLKLDGVIEDLKVLYAVGQRVAAGDYTPQWKDGSEFKAAREASLKKN